MGCNGNLESTWKGLSLPEVKSAYVMLRAGSHKWLEWDCKSTNVTSKTHWWVKGEEGKYGIYKYACGSVVYGLWTMD